MSNKTIDQIIAEALEFAHLYGDAIETARAHPALKGKTPNELHPILLPLVAGHKRYGVPLIDGERKAKGTKVMDSEHPRYQAAKKALSRLIADIVGKSSGMSDEIAVPRHIAALAKQLAEACAEYEQARKLASTALANAFAK